MEKKKDIKIMLKEAALLFAITAIAGLLLGFVHGLTKENIERQAALAIENACREVFPDAAGFELTGYMPTEALAEELSRNGVVIGSVFNALDREGSVLGYVIETASSEGYGGKIDLYIGITMDKTLNGVSILEINETVGLGMEADPVLVDQFARKKAQTFTYTKTGSTSEEEIDAISGATITTKAFVNAVNGGIACFYELEGGNLQ